MILNVNSKPKVEDICFLHTYIVRLVYIDIDLSQLCRRYFGRIKIFNGFKDLNVV